jgi:hypothetical protein
MGSYCYSEVDDPVGSPDDFSSYVLTNNNGVECSAYLGFSAFSIPSGSTSISVKVTVRVYDSYGYASARQQLLVGGTGYQADTFTTGLGWVTDTHTWSTNPKRGSAWTVDDINGVGSYALQYFGVTATEYGYYDSKTGWVYYVVYCTQCYLTVTYTPPTARLHAFACGVGTVVGFKSTSIG